MGTASEQCLIKSGTATARSRDLSNVNDCPTSKAPCPFDEFLHTRRAGAALCWSDDAQSRIAAACAKISFLPTINLGPSVYTPLVDVLGHRGDKGQGRTGNKNSIQNAHVSDGLRKTYDRPGYLDEKRAVFEALGSLVATTLNRAEDVVTVRCCSFGDQPIRSRLVAHAFDTQRYALMLSSHHSIENRFCNSNRILPRTIGPWHQANASRSWSGAFSGAPPSSDPLYKPRLCSQVRQRLLASGTSRTGSVTPQPASKL
jgi:hypothetical protein